MNPYTKKRASTYSGSGFFEGPGRFLGLHHVARGADRVTNQLLNPVFGRGVSAEGKTTGREVDGGEVAKGMGQVAGGSLWALTGARLPGVATMRIPAVAGASRMAGLRTPAWTSSIPGGGTELGRRMLAPVERALGPTFRGLSKAVDKGVTAGFNPARSRFFNLSRMSRTGRFTADTAGRLLSPAGLYSMRTAQTQMRDLEGEFDVGNQVPKWQRNTLAALNYIPNALVRNPMVASLTDPLLFNDFRNRMNERGLENLVPYPNLSQEDLESGTFTARDHQRYTPLPFGYQTLARRQAGRLSLPVSDSGDTPTEVENAFTHPFNPRTLNVHGGRVLREQPVIPTEDGDYLTNRQLLGLHNEEVASRTPPTSRRWSAGGFLEWLLNFFRRGGGDNRT